MCDCDGCKLWRRSALATWATAKAQHDGLVVLLQPDGSGAAFALGDDARLINDLCGHMIRRDTFGVIDVFVCDLRGVRNVLRRHGRRAVLVPISNAVEVSSHA